MYQLQYNYCITAWSVCVLRIVQSLVVKADRPEAMSLVRSPVTCCSTGFRLTSKSLVSFTSAKLPADFHSIVFVMEFSWSILTLGTTWVKNWQALVAIRFFVGLFESAYYPGLMFLIGSWYTKDELGKRSNLFQAATAAGTLISGVLQAGVHKHLNVGTTLYCLSITQVDFMTGSERTAWLAMDFHYRCNHLDPHRYRRILLHPRSTNRH